MNKTQKRFILKVLKKEKNSIECLLKSTEKRYYDLNDVSKISFQNYQKLNRVYLKKLIKSINELEKQND